MDDIRRILDEVTRAWLERRFDDLGRYFDEDIVMKGPALKDLVRGRAPLVASFVDFMTKSKVIHYEDSNHSVHTWDNTATASFDWTITYEQAGKTSTDHGQSLFVFARRQGEWRIVLRVML